MEEILSALRRFFSFAKHSEITVEVNPGTVDKKRLESFRKAGINRLSIGTQSVHDEELAYLGRIHKAEDFYRTYRAARQAGFDNINVDVMAALPGQSVEDYMDNLSGIVELEPEHISAYSLIIEEGTGFYELYGEDREENIEALPLPCEEEERAMYELTERYLAGHGYHRYEISNARQEECEHNKAYWKRKNYVGFGLGAASMVDNVRWKNLTDMEEYMRCAGSSKDNIREDICQLSRCEQVEEFMFLGLRLTEGVSRETFFQVFQTSIEDVYGPVLVRLQKQGLLETGERIRLTPYGRDISNYVMAEFLMDDR